MIRYLSSCTVYHVCYFVSYNKLEVLIVAFVDHNTCAANSSPIKSPSLTLIAPTMSLFSSCVMTVN